MDEQSKGQPNPIDNDMQKDLIRSEGEGFSVMYQSEKNAQVIALKQDRADKRKGVKSMKIKDIMTFNPVCCTTDTNLRDVARMMVECDCGEIPVVDNPVDLRPLGVITDRDIVCRVIALGKNPMELTAGACMSKPCIAVNPETTVEECCRLLEQKQIRRLPVVDEQGCCGIVALADIAAHRLRDQVAEVVEEVSQPHSIN